jgi:hypothetical protein
VTPVVKRADGYWIEIGFPECAEPVDQSDVVCVAAQRVDYATGERIIGFARSEARVEFGTLESMRMFLLLVGATAQCPRFIDAHISVVFGARDGGYQSEAAAAAELCIAHPGLAALWENMPGRRPEPDDSEPAPKSPPARFVNRPEI